MKKQFYITVLIALALAFMPLAFAKPLTDSALGVTYWPVNCGRSGYCLVARLVWYTWNGEMRPITNVQVCFFLNGNYIETATTDLKGFAYILVKLSNNAVFYVKFQGNDKYEASISDECLVRMAHQRWNWWP
jgi:hypothetical protein